MTKQFEIASKFLGFFYMNGLGMVKIEPVLVQATRSRAFKIDNRRRPEVYRRVENSTRRRARLNMK